MSTRSAKPQLLREVVIAAAAFLRPCSTFATLLAAGVLPAKNDHWYWLFHLWPISENAPSPHASADPAAMTSSGAGGCISSTAPPSGLRIDSSMLEPSSIS